jgi:cobalt transporter subunit CbtB
MQNQATVMITSATRVTSLSRGIQLASALLLGLVILYGAGFVQTSAVHNAAHDMRHSAAFPCH